MCCPPAGVVVDACSAHLTSGLCRDVRGRDHPPTPELPGRRQAYFDTGIRWTRRRRPQWTDLRKSAVLSRNLVRRHSRLSSDSPVASSATSRGRLAGERVRKQEARNAQECPRAPLAEAIVTPVKRHQRRAGVDHEGYRVTILRSARWRPRDLFALLGAGGMDRLVGSPLGQARARVRRMLSPVVGREGRTEGMSVSRAPLPIAMRCGGSAR